MTHQRRIVTGATRRSIVVAFVLALVAGPFVAWQGAQGD
jgi:hypothetical protein